MLSVPVLLLEETTVHRYILNLRKEEGLTGFSEEQPIPSKIFTLQLQFIDKGIFFIVMEYGKYYLTIHFQTVPCAKSVYIILPSINLDLKKILFQNRK